MEEILSINSHHTANLNFPSKELRGFCFDFCEEDKLAQLTPSKSKTALLNLRKYQLNKWQAIKETSTPLEIIFHNV